jgi:putative ABC transport system ATP-binding protein
VSSPQGGLPIRLEGVVHLYPIPGGDVVALRGIDLRIGPGELVGLLGPSGMGKSTVLRLLAALFPPSAGRIWIGETDITTLSTRARRRLRGRLVSLVLQGPAVNLLAYATVEENLAFVARGREARQRAASLLDLLELRALRARVVASLSGGEQQRAAIAAALAPGPSVLLMDEPTSQLDREARDEVVDVIRHLNGELGTTVVLVTHDPAVALAMPRVLTIRDGRVGSEGRDGEEFAVVAEDGTIQLPPHIRKRIPPHSLLRVRTIEEAVLLEPIHGDGAARHE